MTKKTKKATESAKDRKNLRHRERSKANKIKLLELHGNMCYICGYDEESSILHFHHIDPLTKSFSVLKNGYASAVKESAKCILVCPNCHYCIHSDNKQVIRRLIKKAKKDTKLPARNIILEFYGNEC